ncbi:MAG: sulfatase-like hydrolase/transferase [Propionibacteriaceae bacterium]
MVQPAILLITTDQLRADAHGCFGGTAVATPHLDALAAESTQFDCAFTASPYCLPSRSSIMTGNCPRNHRAYSNFRDARLLPSTPNVYNSLGGLGYHITHVGKCHYAAVPYSQTKPDETQPYKEFRDYYLRLGIDDLDLQDDKQVSVWFRDDYADELDQAGHLEAYRAAVWDKDAAKVFTFPARPGGIQTPGLDARPANGSRRQMPTGPSSSGCRSADRTFRSTRRLSIWTGWTRRRPAAR